MRWSDSRRADRVGFRVSVPPLRRPKLHSTGRGRRYSRLRGVLESGLALAYRASWPGRAWSLVPGATNVRLVEHDLALLPPGPEPRPPLRIGFASDLHIGPTTPRRVLDNAFALLAAAAPDVLLLGGDYVYLDATPAVLREIEARVRGVPARVKLAVLGNHDLWARHELVEQALVRAGAEVLVNDARRLPAPWEDVAVLGLDDPWAGAPEPAPALAACGDAALRLALCHAPEAVPHLVGRNVSLLLCGHTHGGQVALPWRPIVVHGHCGKRWPSGMWQLGGLHLFVSRGVGTSEIPVRLFARPDVSLITLR